MKKKKIYHVTNEKKKGRPALLPQKVSLEQGVILRKNKSPYLQKETPPSEVHQKSRERGRGNPRRLHSGLSLKNQRVEGGGAFRKTGTARSNIWRKGFLFFGERQPKNVPANQKT